MCSTCKPSASPFSSIVFPSTIFDPGSCRRSSNAIHRRCDTADQSSTRSAPSPPASHPAAYIPARTHYPTHSPDGPGSPRTARPACAAPSARAHSSRSAHDPSAPASPADSARTAQTSPPFFAAIESGPMLCQLSRYISIAGLFAVATSRSSNLPSACGRITSRSYAGSMYGSF